MDPLAVTGSSLPSAAFSPKPYCRVSHCGPVCSRNEPGTTDVQPCNHTIQTYGQTLRNTTTCNGGKVRRRLSHLLGANVKDVDECLDHTATCPHQVVSRALLTVTVWNHKQSISEEKETCDRRSFDCL